MSTSDVMDPSGESRDCRIALYSHDTVGLGHMRRNLLIAHALMRSRFSPSILLVTGSSAANGFEIPPGMDRLTLPALHKVRNGHYESRHLHLSSKKIFELRANTISAALESFDPNVLIVDTAPRGVMGELEKSLGRLRDRHDTRIVLGLRDILDEPATIRKEWAAMKYEEAIRTYFDEIWVYGDPAINNLSEVYGLSSALAGKLSYTGYLDARKRLEWTFQSDDDRDFAVSYYSDKRFVMCELGGGEDGGPLAEAFAATDLPNGYHGLIVTGPFMPRDIYKRLLHAASLNSRLKVIRELKEPTQLLEMAHRVIGMGGYNSVSEILAFRKRALIVPRVFPRTEQLIRVRRLSQLGLLDYVTPNTAGPGALKDWLNKSHEPLPPIEGLIDMNGLKRIPQLLSRLCSTKQTNWSIPVVSDGELRDRTIKYAVN